jgi:outer membrane cobalamin receptor
LSFGRTSLERGYPHIWRINNTPPYVHPLKVAHEKSNDRQEKDSWSYDLSLRSPIRPGMKLYANLYHSRDYSRSLFNPNDLQDDDRPNGFTTDSDARKSGGLLQMDISRFPRNYLILGMDLQLDSVDSHPPDMMFGKHQAQTLAGFAQDRITVSDALAVILGARYDYRHLAESSDEGQVSPKLGVTYQADAHTAFRLSFGQAFRAPSLAEIYIRQSLHSGLTFRENPDLRSEKLRAYAEFGVRRGLFGLLETDTSVFMYDFSDMIFWESLSESEYQVINLNRSVMKGVETGLRFSWRWLSAVAGYTYLDAQDRTEGRADDTLPYKPRHSAHVSLDCEYASFGLGTSLRYVSEVEEAILYHNDKPDALYVLDARLSYNLSDRMLFSIAVDNLLNREYEEMARYRMPGRSVTFKVVAQTE